MGVGRAIAVFILVFLDQLSKIVIRIYIQPSESVGVIEGFFYLVNRVNTGAAWSFLAGTSWGIYFLSGVSFLASVFIIYLIYTINNKKLLASLILICGGSIGNLVDRVLFGGVTDFLDFHFGSYVYPTFNLADSFIVCGSIFLVIVVISDKDALSEIKFFSSEEDKKAS